MATLDPNKFTTYKKALNAAFLEIGLPVACLDIALDPFTLQNFFFIHAKTGKFKYKHAWNYSINENDMIDVAQMLRRVVRETEREYERVMGNVDASTLKHKELFMKDFEEKLKRVSNPGFHTNELGRILFDAFESYIKTAVKCKEKDESGTQDTTESNS